jgi:hypothetical protein
MANTLTGKSMQRLLELPLVGLQVDAHQLINGSADFFIEPAFLLDKVLDGH